MAEISNETIQAFVTKFAEVKEAYNATYGIATQEDFAESDLLASFDETNDAFLAFQSLFMKVVAKSGITIQYDNQASRSDLNDSDPIIIPNAVCECADDSDND